MRVVGLDLSLTSTGVATSHDTARIRPPAAFAPAELGPESTIHRIRHIAARVGKAVADADVVVLESLFPSTMPGTMERIGLFWRVLDVVLVQAPYAGVATIHPVSLKVFATGRGNADKPAMVDAARHHFGNRIGGDDEADAAWCAAIGHAAIGQPILQLLTREQRDAVGKVLWVRPYDAGAAQLRAAERALGGRR